MLTVARDTFITDSRFEALHQAASDVWTLHLRQVPQHLSQQLRREDERHRLLTRRDSLKVRLKVPRASVTFGKCGIQLSITENFCYVTRSLNNLNRRLILFRIL